VKIKPGYKTIAWLLVFWCFATYWNIGKAFHIDDTAHLQIAQWIERNPFHPMSGWVNWTSEAVPISTANQPHLYFYLMAGWAHLFGYSEIAIHSLMALFTLWAICAFYRLAALVDRDRALYVTALFSLSAAFVVGQNSMVDVPLIAVWLEFYHVLLNPRYADKKKYAIAAVLCAIGLLIKYTSLLLVPAMVIHIVLARKYKSAGWILIPAATLLLWSAFNIYDYGEIHILNRPRLLKTPLTYWTYSVTWIVGLGAMLPFAVFGFYAQLKQSASTAAKMIWSILCGLTLLAPAVVLLSAVKNIAVVNSALFFSCVLSGIGVLCMCCQTVKKQKTENENENKNDGNSIQWLLLYWMGSSFLFIVFFAPFMAVRHVLLAMPAVLLLIYPQVARTSNIAKLYWISIALTVFNTTLLAKADAWYAGIYKTNAAQIVQYLSLDVPIWFVGHWGWQWYAQQSGMKFLSNSERPNIGDYLVVPLNIIGGDVPDRLEVLELQTVKIERTYWFQHYANIYFYVSPGLPWGYSNGAVETFKLYRVMGVKN